MPSVRSTRAPLQRALAKALWLCLPAVLTACGPSDPRLDDLVFSGTVASMDGTLLTGASVSLVRTQCAAGTCTPTVRGTDTTGSDGRFEIVVERLQDEQDAWTIVCFEYTASIEAAGYVPIEGHHEVWRPAFCSFGESRGVEFRLEPA